MAKPTPQQGSRGTPRTRQMQRTFFSHVLALTEGMTAVEAAKAVGLKEDDVRNLRRGFMPSLDHLIGVVRKTHYSPESLLTKGTLHKLKAGVSSQGAQTRLVRARAGAIATEEVPADLAKRTGLPISTIYRFRCKGTWIGFHVYAAFVSAGFSATRLLLGDG